MKVFGFMLVTACVLFLSGLGVVRAATIGANGVVSLDLSGDPNDDDDSAIILWNVSGGTGEVTIEYLATNPPGDVEEPFLLLDGTMRITTDLPDGGHRVLIIREYNRAQVRRKSRVAGLRPETLRVMRKRARRANLWRPAGRTIGAMRDRKKDTAAPRRAFRARETGHLGRRGIYATDVYVWAVVDTASDFAVGGVPEPTTLCCLLGGAGVLLWRRRRKA